MKKYNILKFLLGTPFWKKAEIYKNLLKSNHIKFNEETTQNCYGGVYTILYLSNYSDFNKAWELLGIKPVELRIKEIERLMLEQGE